MLTVLNNEDYQLILSDNPCDIFTHFDVKELHGLSLDECKNYNNTTEDAYIAGLCNISPDNGQPFVFINTSRCTSDIHTMGLVMHEMMHLAGIKYNGCWNSDEENMITFAELEAYKIVQIIKTQILCR